MRITKSMLDLKVNQLNRQLNRPITPWIRINGKLIGNVGNFHAAEGFKGFCLHEVTTETGCVQDVFSSGDITKRDLFNRVAAMITGIEAHEISI